MLEHLLDASFLGNPELKHVLRLVALRLLFPWLGLPVLDPRLVQVQLVYDFVDFAQVILVFRPDQMAFALNVLVEVLVVV